MDYWLWWYQEGVYLRDAIFLSGVVEDVLEEETDE